MRLKFPILAFTAAVLLAVAALQALDLWWRRDKTLDAAEARASNVAYVLSEYVRGSVADTDTSLRQLALHARRVGGARGPSDEWNTILLSARAALPDSGSISVVDADGIIRHSTQALIVGQSRKDDYVFQRLSAGAGDELVIDRPLVSVGATKRYIMPIGRKLTTKSGAFDGIIVATITPEAYRTFFRTVDVGPHGLIWVFHPDGVMLFREPSATSAIGANAASNPLLRAALGASTPGILRGVVDDSGPTFVSAYRSLATPPVVVAVSLSMDDVLADWRHQRRTSALAFAALTLTLAAIVLVLFRQISARVQAEQVLADVQHREARRLRESNDRLEDALDRAEQARRETEEASQLKDQFLMTLSHELRTPLTAIHGWVRMLTSGAVPATDQKRALTIIERNVRAQAQLIDDLLDVSRAISGKLRIDARPLDMREVIHAAVETIQPAIDAKRIRFEQIVESGLERVVADPDRLQQILWNLLSNAIKFTPEGGVVRLVARPVLPSRGIVPDGGVEINVADSGVGIAPEFLPHVFERFRQADVGTRRRYGGLGLGLAIVRHLAELHGGSVSAESAGEGRGSTFRVILPGRQTAVMERTIATERSVRYGAAAEH